MAMLHYFRGEERLTSFALRDRRTTIGRSDSCDIVVPGQDVSRRHLLIERDAEGFVATNHGRHGTLLNDALLQGSHRLQPGDALGLPPFRLVFGPEQGRPSNRTSTTAVPPASMRLVAVESTLVLEKVSCEVFEGPAEGHRFELTQADQTIGGPGSDHVIADPTLVRNHMRVLVRSGRPMLRDPRGPVIVDGTRVGVGTLPLYFNEPIRLGDTVLRLRSVLVQEDPRQDSLGAMVGESDIMRRLFGALNRMAAFPAPVLLLGESGTGKELAARGLHEASDRAEMPFVAVNCGAIASTLFESELFGHEKGAFTGADRRRDGAFHQANRGTLFLDEVGELPEEAQTKLLRVLESGEVRRVGASTVEFPDVRIVAATNRDLEGEVAQGRFRQDLYFRLAVLAVGLPPLRERSSDLPLLCRTICKGLGPDVHVTNEAIQVLAGHPFPGNVRELKNVLTRAFVLGGPLITPRAVTFNPWSYDLPPPDQPIVAAEGLGVAATAERDLILDIMRRTKGNRSAAARKLGIARSTLLYKLRRLKIDFD